MQFTRKRYQYSLKYVGFKRKHLIMLGIESV